MSLKYSFHRTTSDVYVARDGNNDDIARVVPIDDAWFAAALVGSDQVTEIYVPHNGTEDGQAVAAREAMRRFLSRRRR
jgi:hypothetical protein